MPRTKASSSKKRSISSNRSLLQQQMDALTAEAYALIASALTLAGVPLRRQRRIFLESSRNFKRIPATSESILQEFRDLSDLLLAWLHDLPYLDATGRPKILPIRGKGASFETLARQFLPTRHLKDAVEFASKKANVIVQKGDRIVFQGDPVVKFADDPLASLAQINTHIRNIVKTVELNRKRKIPETRLLERVVAYPLDPEQFEVFRDLMKPSVNDLTDHGEHVIKSLGKLKPGRTSKTYTAGIGVYLYFRASEKSARPRQSVTRKRRSA